MKDKIEATYFANLKKNFVFAEKILQGQGRIFVVADIAYYSLGDFSVNIPPESKTLNFPTQLFEQIFPLSQQYSKIVSQVLSSIDDDSFALYAWEAKKINSRLKSFDSELVSILDAHGIDSQPFKKLRNLV